VCEAVCEQDIVHEVASVRANVSQCECDESKIERDRVRTWSGCEKPARGSLTLVDKRVNETGYNTLNQASCETTR
jgi:hypothetical protein